VVALILNYVTAHPMIHRFAAMQPRQTALITGANGGVGTALLELLRAFYGITALYRRNKRPFKEDLPKLFELLAARRIEPRIAARLPLLAGRDAERLLEAVGIVGKVVLLRSSDE
jgi:NADPH:quinone reductase-like Zn-dependent oxidoreductase